MGGTACARSRYPVVGSATMTAMADPVPVQETLFGEPPPPPKPVKVRPHTRHLPARTPAEKASRMTDTEARMNATKAATEAAIDKVDANADEAWKSMALSCIGWCAKHMASFTADEVWDALAEYPDLGTHEPAALGPVFLRAARRGWIENSGERRKRSTHKQRHRELTIWRSLIFRLPAGDPADPPDRDDGALA